jgi:hypothetical protein
MSMSLHPESGFPAYDDTAYRVRDALLASDKDDALAGISSAYWSFWMGVRISDVVRTTINRVHEYGHQDNRFAVY